MLGPTALELLDPVPSEDLNLAIAESIPHERNVVLTLSRMVMKGFLKSIRIAVR
jgi:hypothetical protein